MMKSISRFGVALFSMTLLLNLQLLAQQSAKPDAQMKAVLDELAALGGKPIEELSPEEARKQPSPADAVLQVLRKQGRNGPEAVGDVDNASVTLGDHKIPIRIYTPKGKGPFPVILYIHGGGWVIADLNSYDASPRALCNAANAMVISTHYRQAPEARFPAAHDDVWGVYQWVVKNEGKRNYDSKKLAIVGESAGGNMAAAVSMMAKEHSVQMPLYQVLVYPVADLSKRDTPSYQENAGARPLSKAMMAWFGMHTLAKPEDARNPHLSLLLAGDALKAMPPTTIAGTAAKRSIAAQYHTIALRTRALGRTRLVRAVRIGAISTAPVPIAAASRLVRAPLE